MKWCLAMLFSMFLVGCAHTGDDVTPAPTPVVKVKAAEPSPTACLGALNKMDVARHPNTYRRAFLTCDAPIHDTELVRRYVQAMVVTGRFKALHSATAFPSTVDAKLVSVWTKWIEKNL